MRYQFSVLRQRGQRLQSPAVIYPDIQLSSTQTGGFLALQVRKAYSVQPDCLATLFEPKLIDVSLRGWHFIGFEKLGDIGYVQEWMLEPVKSNGVPRQVQAQSPQSRFSES